MSAWAPVKLGTWAQSGGVGGVGGQLLHGRSTGLRIRGASMKDVRQRSRPGTRPAGGLCRPVDLRTIVAAPLQPVDQRSARRLKLALELFCRYTPKTDLQHVAYVGAIEDFSYH